MNLIDKFLAKNFQNLKTFLIIIVAIVIIATETFNYFYFHKLVLNSIFDALLSFILTVILVYFAFYIINIKQRQLNEQLDQLTEAYKYIGQINRKIDSLLELDISTLDHSKNNNLHETSTTIFRQLINLVQAKAGLFYLKPPYHYRLYHDHKNLLPEFRQIFDHLQTKEINEFKHSHGNENEQYFKELGLQDNFLKKYIVLVKPVYMHDKDVGHIYLIFNRNQNLEERDLNIIRIYSFYLALNYTFKPDFSLYQNQLE